MFVISQFVVSHDVISFRDFSFTHRFILLFCRFSISHLVFFFSNFTRNGFQPFVIHPSSEELEAIRLREAAVKRINSMKYSGRHSHFGGTFTLANVKGIAEADAIVHKPLNKIQGRSFLGLSLLTYPLNDPMNPQ